MKYRVLSILLCLSLSTMAQLQNPVVWSYAAKKVSANEAVVLVKATIQSGWHIYSVNQKEGGPEKTAFTFIASKDYSLIGKVSEPKPIKKHEEVFEMDVFYFEKSVVFQQKVKLNKSAIVVKGKVSFMVCTDEECLPSSEISFSIPVERMAGFDVGVAKED